MSFNLLQDGFGSHKFYPVNSEIRIHSTLIEHKCRSIMLQYLDKPFGYRKISRADVESLPPYERTFIHGCLEAIDEGWYDDRSKFQHLHLLMSQSFSP